MYDELVKMLRVCGDSNNSCENCPVRENDGSCPHGEWEFAAEKYMLQAADAIERLADENTRLVTTANELSKMYDKLVDEMPDGWIPVTERLPEAGACGCRVLCVLRKKSRGWVWVDDRLFMDGDFWHPKHQKGKVTHWMPLPEPPHSEFYESLKTALEQAINGKTKSYTLVQALEDAGAEVKPGTGKMFCNGQEVDPEEVFKNCFQPPKEEQT